MFVLQNFKHVFSISLELFVIACCSLFMYIYHISAEVAQQFVIAENKGVVARQLLQCYFKLPIDGTALTPRGTTFLTVYAKHIILANTVE